jgi:hypothetical protein
MEGAFDAQMVHLKGCQTLELQATRMAYWVMHL